MHSQLACRPIVTQLSCSHVLLTLLAAALQIANITAVWCYLQSALELPVLGAQATPHAGCRLSRLFDAQQAEPGWLLP